MKKEKKKPTGDYEVGYCRAPRETRFKKGQSGNPRGRRKNFEVRLAEHMFRGMLQEKIEVTRDGREETMTHLEAILRRTLNDMLTGTAAQRRAGIQLFLNLGWLNPCPEDMRPRREQIAEFLQMLADKTEASDNWRSAGLDSG